MKVIGGGVTAIENIKGLAFRNGPGITVNLRRNWIEKIDDIPSPCWTLFSPAKRYQIVTARGCPYRCIFCKRALGAKVRMRSVENVMMEIEDVVATYKPEEIRFADETFGFDVERANLMLDLMIERGIRRKVKWYAMTRVGLHSLDFFKKMKLAGCHTVSFGVESGNEEVLKFSRKGITLEEVKRSVEMAKQAGLKTESQFIFGHPYETSKTVRDTINFAVQLNTTQIIIGIMVPYPGTELAEMVKCGEGGYRFVSEDWSDYNKHLGDAIELDGLSRRNLKLLQMVGYLEFYIRNLRIVELARFIFEYRREGTALLRKILKGR